MTNNDKGPAAQNQGAVRKLQEEIQRVGDDLYATVFGTLFRILWRYRGFTMLIIVLALFEYLFW